MENKDKFLKGVGDNIRNIRIENNLEIKAVASKLGITIQAYGKIENGKVDLNISRLFEIANLFKIEFNKILNTKGDTFNFTSHNNTGGYHVQKVGVINTSDEQFNLFIKDELEYIKKKINFLESINTK